ncbi:MAG TPA: SRPBCC family protein [Anaerolineales bacterium]|nr:SRPBCC family protein [Anaerolineales bacterium]
MISLEVSIEVGRSPIEVFAFLSEFTNDAKWQADLVRVEKTSSGPVALGSTGRYVAKFLGQEMKNDVVVTVFETPRRFALKTTSGPIQFETVSTLEAAGAGTRLTMTATAEPGGFFKVAEGLVKREAEKTLARDAQRLKEILEA